MKTSKASATQMQETAGCLVAPQPSFPIIRSPLHPPTCAYLYKHR